MRNISRYTFAAAAFAAGLPLVARAHPGHDDHDFTWDFSHLAAHPVATAGCVAVLGLAAAVIWKVSRTNSKRPTGRRAGL